MLDGVTSMILASNFGIGIAFSACILFLWQGSIYLLAQFIGGFMTENLMTEISIVGGILIISSALGILKIKSIKTLNLLLLYLCLLFILHLPLLILSFFRFFAFYQWNIL